MLNQRAKFNKNTLFSLTAILISGPTYKHIWTYTHTRNLTEIDLDPQILILSDLSYKHRYWMFAIFPICPCSHKDDSIQIPSHYYYTCDQRPSRTGVCKSLFFVWIAWIYIAKNSIWMCKNINVISTLKSTYFLVYVNVIDQLIMFFYVISRSILL